MTRPIPKPKRAPRRRRMPGSTLPYPSKRMQSARVNPVKRDRRDAKFRRNFHSKEFVRFTKGRLCAFCRRRTGGVITSHMNARGLGGCGGDWRRTVPACRKCDRKWARGRWTFLRSMGLTWDDVERFIQEHQAVFAAYLADQRRREAVAYG